MSFTHSLNQINIYSLSENLANGDCIVPRTKPGESLTNLIIIIFLLHSIFSTVYLIGIGNFNFLLNKLLAKEIFNEIVTASLILLKNSRLIGLSTLIVLGTFKELYAQILTYINIQEVGLLTRETEKI